MNTFAYSIYDSAAKAFNQPFFMQNDSLAIRAFTDNTNDTSTVINKHPNQFALYKVGMFKDETGLLIPDEQKTLLVEAISVHSDQNKKDQNEELLETINRKLDTIMEVN